MVPRPDRIVRRLPRSPRLELVSSRIEAAIFGWAEIATMWRSQLTKLSSGRHTAGIEVAVAPLLRIQG
jgi:hypothetical protein